MLRIRYLSSLDIVNFRLSNILSNTYSLNFVRWSTSLSSLFSVLFVQQRHSVFGCLQLSVLQSRISPFILFIVTDVLLVTFKCILTFSSKGRTVRCDHSSYLLWCATNPKHDFLYVIIWVIPRLTKM